MTVQHDDKSRYSGVLRMPDKSYTPPKNNLYKMQPKPLASKPGTATSTPPTGPVPNLPK